VRRLALVLVVGLSLAACGGSSNSTTTGPDAEAQIKSAYKTFFSPNSALAARIAVLQNGEQFKPVIQSFASNPLAKNASVTVSSVTLQGQDKAKVVFEVKLGNTSLGQQTGTAVRQGGSWKVGYASLCKLVELQGITPSGCKP